MVPKSNNRREMSFISKLYLALYNFVQSIGWSYILLKCGCYVIKEKKFIGVWDQYGTCVLIFQTLALLEVLHCLVGLVPSSAVITFVQVMSRLFQVWGIIFSFHEIQNVPTVAIVIIVWGVAEVIRYLYYFSTLLGGAPKFLTWCRYSFFMGLYPAGVLAEVSNIVLALKSTKEKFSITLPNAANFSFNFYYMCIFIMLTYIPIFPNLFKHMLHQRGKVLGGVTNSSSQHDITEKVK